MAASLAPVGQEALVNSATLGLTPTQQDQIAALLQQAQTQARPVDHQLEVARRQIDNSTVVPHEQDLHLIFDLNGPQSDQELEVVLESQRQAALQKAQIYTQTTTAIWLSMTQGQRTQLLEIVSANEEAYTSAAGKKDILLQLNTAGYSTLFPIILRFQQELGLSQAQKDALLAKNAEWTPKYLEHTGSLRQAQRNLHDATFDKKWKSDQAETLANATVELAGAASSLAESFAAFERDYALAQYSVHSIISGSQHLAYIELSAQEYEETYQIIADFQEPMRYVSSGMVVSSLTELDRQATLQRLQEAMAALSAPNPTQVQLDDAGRKTRLALDKLER